LLFIFYLDKALLRSLTQSPIAASSTAPIKVSSHSTFGFQASDPSLASHHMRSPPATRSCDSVHDLDERCPTPTFRHGSQHLVHNIDHLDILLNLPTGPVSAVIAFLSDGWRFACMHACTRETLTRGGRYFLSSVPLFALLHYLRRRLG
jgi:hypothetical protein